MNNNNSSKPHQHEMIHVTILSAHYFPCETGPPSEQSALHTRDVTPFVKAFLLAEQYREQQHFDMTTTIHATNHNKKHKAAAPQQEQSSSVISLSAICPETGLRRTKIRILRQQQQHLSSMNCVFGDPLPGTSKRLSIAYRIHNNNNNTTLSASFAEHEPVSLPLFPRRLRQETTRNSAKTTSTLSSSSWRLPPHMSETVLPWVLPFLEWPERVQCRSVCTVWRDIVRERGVAVTIDTTHRRVAQGLLSHSYASLVHLVLTRDTTPADLQNALPHVQRLRSLDISRCILLGDETLQLIATSPVQYTLQVLYMKGVTNVTDQGLWHVATSCQQLKVLDLSYLVRLTDAGIASLQQLPNLRALFLRDNFRLENFEFAGGLYEQLTLFGCIGLKQLPPLGGAAKCLVSLNVWGCHSLTDDAATALQGLERLRSLIVSECHRLTDAFVCSVARHVPWLHHFHLRYCKKLSDTSVYAIAEHMYDLYSLDMSFCSKLTASSLRTLFELRGTLLSELRLRSCRLVDERNELVQGLCQQGALSFLDVRGCTHLTSQTSFQQGMAELEFQQDTPHLFTRPARWNPDIERRLVKQMIGQQRYTES